ncbi:MAG: hypothetical protein JEZ06_24390 [Anaerolineaceae bacterium]|nr:hypothetical protein [Anaerolineaceae bacterium]
MFIHFAAPYIPYLIGFVWFLLGFIFISTLIAAIRKKSFLSSFVLSESKQKEKSEPEPTINTQEQNAYTHLMFFE